MVYIKNPTTGAIGQCRRQQDMIADTLTKIKDQKLFSKHCHYRGWLCEFNRNVLPNKKYC